MEKSVSRNSYGLEQNVMYKLLQCVCIYDIWECKSMSMNKSRKYLSANTYVYCIRYELVVTFVKIHTNDI